ncbi:hypothetical protein FKB34_00900 [Glycocaulis profundi]|nr:hypothetical protein FKB34_00900 [Glycocaulis profundi]
MSRHALALIGGAVLLAAPMPVATAAAAAQPPHCPPGHAMKGWCSPGQARDARHSRDDRRSYERGYRDGQRDAWRAGQRLPRDVNYRVIRDYERHGYGPPPRGHAYYEVDGEVLLIQTATQLIVEALSR